MMDDMTFCLEGWEGQCKVTRCERHPNNIRDRTIPHSFANFYQTDLCPLDCREEKDAVEVIRCNGCSHHDTHNHRCKIWNHGVVGDGYCYMAERRYNG